MSGGGDSPGTNPERKLRVECIVLYTLNGNLACYINFVFQRSIASVVTLTSPTPPSLGVSSLPFLPTDRSNKGQ